MNIANEILKNTTQLINDLNKKAQAESVDVKDLQERVRVIDMLLQSITRIERFD